MSILQDVLVGYSVHLTATLLFAIVAWQIAAFRPRLHSGFPALGIESKGWGRFERAREVWRKSGKAIIDQGLKQFPGAFQVFTDVGPKIILPNRFADEIRNNPNLNFSRAINQEFFGSYPGFEPFSDNHDRKMVLHAIRGRLTQSLGLITEELAEETDKAVHDIFGKPEEFTEIMFKNKLLQVVARVSSRVFIGPEMSQNKDWLQVSQEYAMNAFMAVNAMRKWHPALRPIVHWFIPECRKARETLDRARAIITPVIQKRLERNRKAAEAGQTSSKTSDAIAWFDEASEGRPYDAAVIQLGLSFAAIHTTTEFLSGMITDLCANPEYFEPLRQEIRTVLGDKGWRKQTLYDLKLLDSTMKESQRQHPGGIGAMSRRAEQAVTLSDGTKIPKGAVTMVAIESMYDETIFPEPRRFKPSRFLEMRQQPGHENRWQFVTVSPEHMSFGLGDQSCPGRFFASNEIKIIMVHLLMRYDWKFTKEGRKDDQASALEVSSDPLAKVLIRAREVEVAI
jgi:cytochrome P450